MTDHLSPQSPTWARGIPEPSSITEVPAWYRALADEDEPTMPRRATELRQMADTLDKYLPMRAQP